MGKQNDFDFDEMNIDEENELDVEIVDIAGEEEFDDSSNQNVFVASAKPLKRTRHFTARQRRIQALITVSTVSILLCVLLSSYAPMRNRIVQTLVPPIASGTPKSGPDVELFYFNANPTWGQFFIDGKRVVYPPRSDNGNNAPLKLVRGKHVLRWVVAPFVPQQCSVTVPFDATTDTCRFNLFTQYLKDVGAWLFHFPMSLAQLPRPAFTDLVAAVQTELDTHASTETVLPGETYAVNTTGESIRHATKRLKATLHYQLDVENTLDGICSTMLEESTPCTFNGQECYLFCAIPLLPEEIRTHAAAWDVFATVQATWEYSTQDGTVLAQSQPELLGTTVVYDHLIPLHVAWDGTKWHVVVRTFQVALPDTQQQLDVPCNTALNTIKSVLVPTTTEQKHTSINWQYISSTNPAEGCLSIATLSYGQDASTHPVAYCLHRFGVLLAANAVAHAYWPSLPVADAHEQQLARQLAALQDDA